MSIVFKQDSDFRTPTDILSTGATCYMCGQFSTSVGIMPHKEEFRVICKGCFDMLHLAFFGSAPNIDNELAAKKQESLKKAISKLLEDMRTGKL